MITIRNAHEGEAEVLSEIGLRAWQKAMAPIGEADAMASAARSAFMNFAETRMVQAHAESSEAITFFKKNGYSIHWLSVAYNPKLDRDVPSVGLSKPVSSQGEGPYGAF